METPAPIEKDYCDYWPKSKKTSRFQFDIASAPYRKNPEWWRAIKFSELERGAVANAQGTYHTVCDKSVCPTSEFCVSSRINFASFDMSNSQRKKYEQFREMAKISIMPGNHHDPDIFALYKRYVTARHSDTRTTMTRHTAEDFREAFLNNAWTVAAHERGGELLAAAFVDQHGPDFSIEYQVYNTDRIDVLKKISPGKAMIRTLAVVMSEVYPDGHLYMGSLSAGSPKLGYKSEFMGTEVYRDGVWQPIAP